LDYVHTTEYYSLDLLTLQATDPTHGKEEHLPLVPGRRHHFLVPEKDAVWQCPSWDILSQVRNSSLTCVPVVCAVINTGRPGISSGLLQHDPLHNCVKLLHDLVGFTGYCGDITELPQSVCTGKSFACTPATLP
jgi:hypothetical protein